MPTDSNICCVCSPLAKVEVLLLSVINSLLITNQPRGTAVRHLKRQTQWNCQMLCCARPERADICRSKFSFPVFIFAGLLFIFPQVICQCHNDKWIFFSPLQCRKQAGCTLLWTTPGSIQVHSFFFFAAEKMEVQNSRSTLVKIVSFFSPFLLTWSK